MTKLHFPHSLMLTMVDSLRDALWFIQASLRCAWAAENLFLRKELALYFERKLKPRRARPCDPVEPSVAVGKAFGCFGNGNRSLEGRSPKADRHRGQ
jgi:hypothetical protein